MILNYWPFMLVQPDLSPHRASQLLFTALNYDRSSDLLFIVRGWNLFSCDRSTRKIDWTFWFLFFIIIFHLLLLIEGERSLSFLLLIWTFLVYLGYFVLFTQFQLEHGEELFILCPLSFNRFEFAFFHQTLPHLFSNFIANLKIAQWYPIEFYEI